MGRAEELSVDVRSLDHDTEAAVAQYHIEAKKAKTWKGYLWDTWDLPEDERKMLLKVDAIILTFASLGYFLKNIDQTNINNAFLSGMKEDLGMYGNELVTATSVWTVGYVIGQIPSNLLLTRVSPRWVIPTLEIGWGIATFATTSVQSYKALYAWRFLVGLFESGFYPGIHYMLGSWYTPRELGKRAMIFWLAGSLGQMFSGFLQAAAYTNLHGVGGREGWRWLFIIDGIITVPVAIMGFVCFPNLPQDGPKTWWITDAEHELSKSRMRAVGRAGKEPWSRAKLARVFSSWHPYLLPLLYVVWNNGFMQPAMGFWLKSFNSTPAPVPGVKYSVQEINNLPSITVAIFIGVALGWGLLSDGPLNGRRWPLIYGGAIITLVFGVLLRQMPLYTNIPARTAVYYLSNIGLGAGPLILTWINELCSGDTEKRALLVAAGNDLAYVVQAVAPNFVWKTTAFPAAIPGYTWTIVMQILTIVVCGAIHFLSWRDSRKAKEVVSESEDSDSQPEAVNVH